MTTSLPRKHELRNKHSRNILGKGGEKEAKNNGAKHHSQAPALLLPAMNRPSRTDDDLEHPTWNQNPPFLAADLTTRQDLNGIANAREHRHGCSATGNGACLLVDEKHAVMDVHVCECDTTGSRACSPSAVSCRLQGN